MKAKHELKIEPKYFEAVKDGRKKFEIRKNDRNYQEGDILVLLEYDKYYEAFTGEKITVEISYMTDYAQQDGYVVLGIEEIWEGEELTEIKKVVVPKFVAEWLAINKLSSDLIQLYEEVEYATDSDGFIEGKWDYSGEFYDWIVGDTDNIYKLSDALRYGYEIEKEKLHLVETPSEHYDDVKKYFTGFSEKSIKPEFSYAQKDALKFVDFEKAKSVAYLIIGNVREVEG